MKYPTILKSNSEHDNRIMLAFNKNECQRINSEQMSNYCGFDFDTSDRWKNITTEYLANTYGEVKSKEHAEFIVELAEVNNLKVWGSNYDDICTFIVTDGELSFHNHDCKRSVAELNLKQITIPLPPESNVNTPEEDFEMKQIEKNNGDNLIFGEVDKQKSTIKPVAVNFNVAKGLDLSFETSEITSQDGGERVLNINVIDNKIFDYNSFDDHLMNSNRYPSECITDADKCKEWPCVGDEVEAKHPSGQTLKGELLAKTKEYAIIQQLGHEQHLHLSAWKFSKPKTPEKELFESFWREVGLFMNHSNLNKKIFESAFINNITKKQQ